MNFAVFNTKPKASDPDSSGNIDLTKKRLKIEMLFWRLFGNIDFECSIEIPVKNLKQSSCFRLIKFSEDNSLSLNVLRMVNLNFY